MLRSRAVSLGLFLLLIASVPGCLEARDKRKSSDQPTPPAHESGATVAANTGTVEGVVIMDGDPPSVQPGLAERIPKECPDALQAYHLLFREGPGRKVADVFVAVTGYQGALGERRGAVPVVARGCTWDRRTYGMTPGQNLAVKSADRLAYVPKLFGAKSGASLVAVPDGEPVPVFAKGPGMYVLVDEMRNFVQATVLVVKYPTFDVTGLDGKFRIEGVPAGTANVSALLPSVNLTVEQKINVVKHTTTRVELRLRFDAAAFSARPAAAPSDAGGSNPASAASSHQ